MVQQTRSSQRGRVIFLTDKDTRIFIYFLPISSALAGISWICVDGLKPHELLVITKYQSLSIIHVSCKYDVMPIWMLALSVERETKAYIQEQ